MTVYDHRKVEKKWQQFWRQQKTYSASPTRSKKYYLLVELAYTSGDLHIGHWFAWSAPDVFARFKRMQGYNVLFPVGGFDAFGLPAENAAIKHDIHPKDWTYKNIATMRQQFATLGPSFDWDKEVITADPDYYKWTQWLFIQLYKQGLAYRGQVWSNWCPECQTVLANEHVENGCCWRHASTPVEQKLVDQWLIKITAYADRLIWPAKLGVDWPAAAREGQNNWIGRKEGMVIKFNDIEVFTTRPDTLAGATFVALPSGESNKLGDKTKWGEFTGKYVVNPLTKREIPVWKANYVTAEYGSGAIMGVPAHDARDREFATKYGIEIVAMEPDLGLWQRIEKEGWGRRTASYHLRDWSVSRRRYWAAPVPIIYCRRCYKSGQKEGVEFTYLDGQPYRIYPVPETDLPVTLPENVDYTPTGKAPLATAQEWLKVRCPVCRGEAKREAETLDTYVDSAWYFFRYPAPKFDRALVDRKAIQDWMPIQVYFGGPEHVLGHTLYARFITKFLHDRKLIDFDEFALKRIHHGVILGPDGHRMSKSRGNVVNPDEQVRKYGADAVRLYLCFLGPHEKGGTWKLEGIEGMKRFLNRVWVLFEKPDLVLQSEADSWEVLVGLHRTIRRVTQDLERYKFNTAIAGIMEFVNLLGEKAKLASIGDGRIKCAEWEEALRVLNLLLAPFAPHLAEEVWQRTGRRTGRTGSLPVRSVHLQSWPRFDNSLLTGGKVTVVVQVNGKVRERLEIEIEKAQDQEHVQQLATQSAKVKNYLNKASYRTIFVPGKLINFVC